MDRNSNFMVNDTVKSLAQTLGVVLPFLQFFFNQLPEEIRKIYVQQETFLVTSIVALLFSIFIMLAYRSYPHFNIPLNKKKYYTWLINRAKKNTDDRGFQKEPFKFTPSNVAGGCMALFLLIAYFFIFIGLSYTPSTITPVFSAFQSLSYILIITMTVYLLSHFAYKEGSAKTWEYIIENRIQSVINLAISHNGFDEYPNPKFISLIENVNNDPSKIAVRVKIREKDYIIVAGVKGEILYNVSEVRDNPTQS